MSLLLLLTRGMRLGLGDVGGLGEVTLRFEVTARRIFSLITGAELCFICCCSSSRTVDDEGMEDLIESSEIVNGGFMTSFSFK
uniref:Secreted protein n=1 Tax=Lepeophtheirus salmonis TaxID=72036 RepID=A0A0K2VB79_LEPSM